MLFQKVTNITLCRLITGGEMKGDHNLNYRRLFAIKIPLSGLYSVIDDLIFLGVEFYCMFCIRTHVRKVSTGVMIG